MKPLLAALALCMALPAAARCAVFHADPECWGWEPRHTALELGFSAAVAVDWLQTRHLALNPADHREVGPFLPTHPTLAQVNVTCAAALLGHALVSLALPSPWRDLWQSATILVGWGNVGMNFGGGLRFGF